MAHPPRLALLALTTASVAALRVRSTPGFLAYSDFAGAPYTVAFDNRSILIGGQRTLLLSAGWHYPRFSPGTWDDVLDKAIADGHNQVQTYVFWWAQQWREDEWDFSTFNLTRWILAAGQRGLFVNLRIGCVAHIFAPDTHMRAPLGCHRASLDHSVVLPPSRHRLATAAAPRLAAPTSARRPSLAGIRRGC